MKYHEIDTQIKKHPHVTKVRWNEGNMFIFLDFSENEAKKDASLLPPIMDSTSKALASFREKHPDDTGNNFPLAYGYVGLDHKLFAVTRLTTHSIETIRTSLARVLAREA